MPLLGKAVVAIWNDITAEGRETFIEWHNREHIPERVAITGFRRGRRYVAESGAPEYYTLYEADDGAVLVSDEYLARLNNPTPWTKQATSAFRNTLRGICEVVTSIGQGDGGHMLTLRFDAAAGRRDELMAHLAGRLADIHRLQGICGAHLCIADAASSGIETAERKGRQVDVPNWVVMVEGCSRAAVEEAGRQLPAAMLAARGMAGSLESGLYRLEFSLADAAGDQLHANGRKES